MIDLCIAITVSLTCSWWTIDIVESDYEVNEKWKELGGKGFVQGFFDPNTKTIVIHWRDLENFAHEWKHAYCYEWYFFHLGRNHETICEPFPHFKVQI